MGWLKACIGGGGGGGTVGGVKRGGGSGGIVGSVKTFTGGDGGGKVVGGTNTFERGEGGGRLAVEGEGVGIDFVTGLTAVIEVEAETLGVRGAVVGWLALDWLGEGRVGAAVVVGAAGFLGAAIGLGNGSSLEVAQ